MISVVSTVLLNSLLSLVLLFSCSIVQYSEVTHALIHISFF
jgi:hypothetical protein